MRMKVQGYWWTWDASNIKKRDFMAELSKSMITMKEDGGLSIQFDNGDDDALIWYYDSLLKYVDKQRRS